MLDDDEPRGAPALAQPVLDRLGIDELSDYVRALRAEITRAEAVMEAKRGQRAAAELFFRPR